MARATFVKSAQKDIYEKGKYVTYTSKKGKREGQEKSKLDRTIPADKNDKVFIAKGESYYWWQFKNGGKHLSKTAPKPSQLTQSNYLSQLYTIQETISDISAKDVEVLQSIVEEIKSELENLKDETQGSLDNMPENLQSSPNGELLQERIDALESAIDELESIDLDYDEPDEDDIRTELQDEATEGEKVSDEDVADKKQEMLDEWLNEKIEEIQGISLEG